MSTSCVKRKTHSQESKNEESKNKKKKNIHIFTSVSLVVGVSKKNVLFKRVYIGLVHRRRKERYTQVLAREKYERKNHGFSPCLFSRGRPLLPFPCPCARTPERARIRERGWLAGAALTKHSQTVSRKRAQPAVFFSSLALVFPRRRSENCDCTVKDDPSPRAKGEGRFAR